MRWDTLILFYVNHINLLNLFLTNRKCLCFPVLKGEKQHVKGEVTILQKHLIIYLYIEMLKTGNSKYLFNILGEGKVHVSLIKFNLSYLIICPYKNPTPKPKSHKYLQIFPKREWSLGKKKKKSSAEGWWQCEHLKRSLAASMKRLSGISTETLTFQ